jgi:type IX secretion system PorP/SprF family membrane protein
MKKITGFILSALMIITICAKGQDLHLSQYDMATLYLNPALTGMYGGAPGDYKVYNDYRSQWGALGTNPFTDTYLAFDMPLQAWGKSFGVGGYFVNSTAPQGGFNNNSLMGSVAYDIMSKNTSNGKHYLTTGLQLGILYQTINPNYFTYDDQYSEETGTFIQSMPSGENLGRTSTVNFDANIGIFYKYIDSTKFFHPFAGFSIQHLVMPNVSLTTTRSDLPMRFNLYGGCDFTVNEKWQLSPSFLYMNQAAVSELDLGALAYYKISTTPFKLIFGGDFRNADAAVLDLGVKYGEHIFRFSYDINTSYLSNFTYGQGAWEFSLMLTIVKGYPLFGKNMYGIPKKSTPKFM